MNLIINQNQHNKKENYGYNPRIISDVQKSPADTADLFNDTVVCMDDSKDDSKLVSAVTVPVWAALASSMQVFNKHCATVKKNKKETSILHNVQDFSDKVGKNFDSSKTGKFLNKKVSNISSFFQNKINSKNGVLSALINTPAHPESSMAKMISKGTIAETAQDAVEAIQRYCANNGKTIEELGLMKNADFLKVCENPYKNLAEIKSILKKIPEQPIEVCTSKTPIIKTILSRKVYPSELMNKINTLTGVSLRNEKKKLSSFGKIFPKAFLKTTEGLTNGTAGGKVAILMQAYSIADAIIRCAKAPKGEKLETFMEAITYDLSYYLMMPIGMGLMYHVAGLKYAGMSPKDVDAYRAGIKALNDKVALGKCTKEEYKAMRASLKKQLNGNSSILLKPFKAVGKLLSTGLEKIAPFTNESTSAFEKTIKNIPNKFKGLSGGTMRFILYMFVIAPPLAKAVTKISHLIFGKPTNSVIDEVEEKNVGTVTEDDIRIVLCKQKPNREFEKSIYSEKTNYFEMYEEAQRLEAERQEILRKPEKKVEITPQVETKNSDVTTYIPSTKGVMESCEDFTDVRRAIKNSMLIEKKVDRNMKSGLNPFLGN